MFFRISSVQFGDISARDLVLRRIADRPRQAHDPAHVLDVVGAEQFLQPGVDGQQLILGGVNGELEVGMSPFVRRAAGHDKHRRR
jgi:hypothetical protein